MPEKERKKNMGNRLLRIIFAASFCSDVDRDVDVDCGLCGLCGVFSALACSDGGGGGGGRGRGGGAAKKPPRRAVGKGNGLLNGLPEERKACTVESHFFL